MKYRLRTLGSPALTDERGESPPGLGPGKPLAVLCYLAVEGEARRETVAALLWGESGEDRARNAFRQALHRLRNALGEDVVPHDPDTVRIARAAELWVDVDEFERALSERRPHDAVALVEGDFLEGFEIGEPGFDHWADGERARIRARYLGALRTAATTALREGRTNDGVRYAERLARAESLDSSAAVLHARALAADGRAAEAARLLEAHASHYRAEVDEDPPEEVSEALGRLSGSRPASDESRPAPAAEAASKVVLHPAALQRLMAAWRGAAAGEAATVLLTGEAGSGKTWLVDELVRRTTAVDQPLVLRGSVRMGRHGLPYAAVGEALRGVLRARGLAGASTHLLAEASRLLPELRDRFDLPLPDPIRDETGRLRFFEGVASLLDAVAFEQPVLLALEGLEAADDATADLLHFLVSRLQDSSILFLAVMERGGAGAELRRRLGGSAEQVDLDPVEPGVLDAFLAERVPGLDARQRSAVAGAADGNAWRALQLARRTQEGLPLGSAPVPLQDALAARVAASSPRERRILVVLALLGRRLPIDQLSAATHLPAGSVLHACDALRRAGLVRERTDGVELSQPEVAGSALDSTGPAGLALLAGWTAEALAAAGAASDAELATLFARAGRRREGARYSEAAGRLASLAGDREAAAMLYRQALDLSDDPDTRARLRRLLAGAGEPLPYLSAGGDGGGARPGRRRRAILLGAAIVVVALTTVSLVWEPDVRRGSMAAERVVRDTLVLVRTDPGGGHARLGFTGAPETAMERRPLVLPEPSQPRWLDSVARAGGVALIDPTASRVAVSESGDGGQWSLTVTPFDRSGRTFVTRTGSRLTPLAWAPDGSRLLFSREDPAGAGLWLADLGGGGTPVAVDTVAGHAVLEAAWSPDGTRIAWTARREDESQRDVFLAMADGSERRNLTDYSADDYHVAWAPDGARVAFTSDREGNAEIFAIEILSGRLWRLTWSTAHDDRPAFSPDGEYLAFESTRGGQAGIYVVSSWGGQPARVSGEGQRVQHAGWRGYPPPHLIHLRFQLPPPLEPGQRAQVVVEPVYDDYITRNRDFVRWRSLDPDIVALSSPASGRDVPSGAMADTFVVARARGLGRIEVSAGGWRTDTAFVKVGTGAVEILSERFGARADGRWIASGGAESGSFSSQEVGRWVLPANNAGVTLLSRASLPLAYGATIHTRVVRRGPPASGDFVVLALAVPWAAGDGGGEERVRVAELLWEPVARRATFRVDREEHTETLAAAADEGEPGALTLRIDVDAGGAVVFSVADALRWRSDLRLTGIGLPLHRARVLIGGRGEGGALALDRVEASIPAAASADQSDVR